MNRRTFVSSLTLGLLAAPLAAEAQPLDKVRRIGYLDGASSSTNPDRQWSVPAVPDRGDPPASRPRHDQDPGARPSLGRQHFQRSGAHTGTADSHGGLYDRDAGRPALDPDGTA